MKLECSLSQMFGVNPSAYYPLKGHTGIDEYCGYGSDIHSYWDMTIYKVIKTSAESTDGSGYTGIFGIIDNGVELFEGSIGHCSEVLVDENDIIKKGDLIGREGNKGYVFQGGVQITLAMQAQGDPRGSHRHNQYRALRRVTTTTAGKKYLMKMSGGQLYENGFYYEFWDANNGYNGTRNPLASLFRRYLITGMSGYDVFCLQRLLAKEGVDDFKETGFTGFYGPRTFSAIWKFQSKAGFTPTGHVGPATLSLINLKTLTL